MEIQKYLSKFGKKKLMIVGAAVILFLLLIIVIATISLSNREEPKPEIITQSSIEQIIHVSDLSTYEAVYNGIAEVPSEKNEDKIAYYVSYEATVKAGFDFKELDVVVDNDTKSVVVTIPEISITKIIVEESTLDFIFMDDKANQSTVFADALKACEADVLEESTKESAIIALAKENAENIVTALVQPFVNQLDAEYTVTVVQEG